MEVDVNEVGGSAPDSAVSHGSKPRMDDGETVSVAPGAGSVETNCPICLDEMDDKSFLDTCFHSFCFPCIAQWAEVAAKCPLCKAEFQNVIHDVKANDDYKTYPVGTRAAKPTVEVNISEARRFRYRTTLDGTRRSQQNSRLRPSSRRPASDERRRTVYRAGLRALPMASTDGKIRIRDISAAFFKRNPATTHRLLPWLSREFRVLLGEEHVEFMIQLILSLIEKIDLESPQFVTHLRPFFHEKTDLFLHEFISFAKSPLDMIAYDARVSYGLQQQQQLSSAVASSSAGSQGDSEVERSQGQATIRSVEPDGHSARSSTESTCHFRQRIFDELAQTSWEDSPPLLRTAVSSTHSEEGEEEEGDSRENPITIEERDEAEGDNLSNNEVNLHPSELQAVEATNLETIEGMHEVIDNSFTNAEPAVTHSQSRKQYSKQQARGSFISRQRSHSEKQGCSEKMRISMSSDETSRNYKERRSPSSSSYCHHSTHYRHGDYHGTLSRRSSARCYKVDESSSDSTDSDDRDDIRYKHHSAEQNSPLPHCCHHKRRKHHRDRHRHHRQHSYHHRSRHGSHSRRRSAHWTMEDAHSHHKSSTHYNSDSDHAARHKSHSSRHISKSPSHDHSCKTHEHHYHHKCRCHHSHHQHDKRALHKRPSKASPSHTCLQSSQEEPPESSAGTSSGQNKLMRNVSVKDLTQELCVVQEELVQTKRKLLKTLLHDERLQLLRNSLLVENIDKEAPAEGNSSPSMTFMQSLPPSRGKTRHKSVEELTSELKAVEEAIVHGKKQVLKVSKRLEVVQLKRSKEDWDVLSD